MGPRLSGPPKGRTHPYLFDGTRFLDSSAGRARKSSSHVTLGVLCFSSLPPEIHGARA